jgi:predicted TIM-barrel fold metal-dependent hydrolase
MELTYAGQRIYNRWLADFCSVAPERHVGLAHLPVWDIDLAIRELHWARGAGLRGVNFPAPRPSLPDYNDPAWDPFWSACEANDMPLDTHGGSEILTTGLARYAGLGGARLLRRETSQLSTRALPWMILGGVFDRHPALKLILTEVPGLSAALPAMLLELDELAAGGHTGLGPSGLSKRPSEYMSSNCFIGASFMSHADAQSAVDQHRVNNYLWGSDYPHREGTYPWSKFSLRMCMEDIAPDHVRRMAGLNLVDTFGLDQKRLQELANRVGPTLDELTTPLSAQDMPTEPPHIEYSMGFRSGVAWL